MYNEIKIQLFIDIIKVLETLNKNDTFKVKGDVIEGDNFSMRVWEERNNIYLEIEEYKTGCKYQYNAPWFELDKETDTMIRKVMEEFAELSKESRVSLNNGIKSILTAQYQDSNIVVNDLIIDEGTMITHYELLKNIFISIHIYEEGTVTTRLILREREIDSSFTMNIRDFTTTFFITKVLPIYDGLIREFVR